MPKCWPAILALLTLTAGSVFAGQIRYVPDAPGRWKPWRFVAYPDNLRVSAAKATEFTITAKDAIKLLEEAVAAAEKLGLVWQKEPVKLTPSPNLVALLKRSQDIAAKMPADAAAE